MDSHFAIRPPAPSWLFAEPMRFRLCDIYLVCREQGNKTLCDFMLPWATEDDFIRENGKVVGICGEVYVPYLGYGYYGTNIEDVVMNYTQYLEKHTAARRIQRAWKRYKAAQAIKRAWKRWLTKKNELWNPRCFVGVAFLALEAMLAIKATA